MGKSSKTLIIIIIVTMISSILVGRNSKAEIINVSDIKIEPAKVVKWSL